MILTEDDYKAETGLSRTLDLDSAISLAVKRTVEAVVFKKPGAAGTPGRFTSVVSEWASFNDRAVPPVACVLAENELRYGEALLTPSLLEETWARRGEQGLGLYKESEGEQDLTVVVRAATKLERSAVCMAVEDAFSTPADPRQARYGILVAMPEYWGLLVRLAIQAKSRPDSTESATKNRWEASFTVRAQAPKVKIDRVVPFRIKTTVTI